MFTSAYAAEFVTENGTITVSDVPDNGTLIVAAYGENNALLGCKLYNSKSADGTITANYAEDLGEYINSPNTTIKQFLWDMNTLKPFTLTPAGKPSDEKKAIVIYFSATGTTKTFAEKIAETAGADIFEIAPSEPYTSADLNYNDDNCRANQEMNDESARPAIANRIENIDAYDTIFIGYPIWWGTMPRIINTFLDTYDLSSKTIMPFCTSGGSGISSSVSEIKAICPDSTVTTGFRGTASTDDAQIQNWLDNNNFRKD